jgi:perosamine synthetase
MKNSTCAYNAPLRTVLEAINHEPAGTSFIIDDAGKLCGIVTDGDFRRLLLKGKGLDDQLSMEDIGDFIFAKKGEKLEELIKKTNKKIRLIPIIDEEGFLIDYFIYDHKTRFTPIAEPSLSSKELEYLMDAYTSTWISSRGKYIDQFESGFASFCEVKHGVATSNGTVAIHLALKALNIGEGDEVIIPDLTFAATINAVLLAGAKPIIVDIEEDSWTISPQEIRAAITPKTKAIIPVHVYGQACRMDEIMAIAKQHQLYIIEDCAEAHGAKFNGQKVGSFGDINTFSFFANKIITTGEGGMCLTNSDELNTRLRKLRDHGMNLEKKYWHDEVGFNYRMTNLQAAIGCAQLEKIETLIERNRLIERNYIDTLDELKVFTWQQNLEGREKVVWLMTALSEKKEEINQLLKANNIDFRPFFYCLSDMPIYESYAFSPNPIAKNISRLGMNLPTVENVDYLKIKELLTNLK